MGYCRLLSAGLPWGNSLELLGHKADIDDRKNVIYRPSTQFKTDSPILTRVGIGRPQRPA